MKISRMNIRMLNSSLLTVLFALAGPVSGMAATTTCHSEDIACLIAAIHDANTNGASDNAIILDAGGTYTLTAVENDTDGPNGLPSVLGTLTIQSPGPDRATIQRGPAAPAFRLFHVGGTGNLKLKNLRLLNGFGVGGLGGGAIYNNGQLSIADSAVTSRSSGIAGAFINNGGSVAIVRSTLDGNVGQGSVGAGFAMGGSLTITDSLITNNNGAHQVGGIVTVDSAVAITGTTFSGNVADGAGAFWLLGGTLVVANSTFLNNRSAGTGTGGAVLIGGRRLLSEPLRGGTALITNTTFSNNQGTDTSFGFAGTIHNALGNLSLLNSTVVGRADVVPPGFHGITIVTGCFGCPPTATTTLQNTILVHKPDDRIFDCSGPVTSLGNNVITSFSPTGCTIALQPSDITGDGGLDAFTDNGTPGNGHYPLLPTSPAIDAGAPACPPKDQIGESRHGPCDIGSIEFVPPVKTVTFEMPPGSSSGPINPRGRGVTPAAILTTDDFDATAVDVNSLRLGKTGTEAAIFHYTVEDVNEDGRLDLVLQFKTQDLSAVCGDTSLLLKGSTIAGLAIQATATIVTVGCQQ